MVSELSIYVLSDSIGDTAQQVVRSITAQFPQVNVKLRRFSNVLTKKAINQIFKLMDPAKSNLVFYTFVEESLADYMKVQLDQVGIRGIDIISPGLQAIELLTGQEPDKEAGRIRKTDDEYFDRIKAIEFAVRYDDGQEPHGVLKADLTLIGVSRTSKTPLSMYLANKGYKVANIPLFPENKPPKELFQVSPSKVVGLTNSVNYLNQVRKERLKSYGMSTQSRYVDKKRILEELQYGEEIMKQIGCLKINVESKAIEETAAEILQYLEGLQQKDKK